MSRKRNETRSASDKRRRRWLCLGAVAVTGALLVAPGCDGDGMFFSFDDRGDVGDVTAEGPRTAGLRRLTVDELQASIPIAAGADEVGEPIIWATTIDNQQVDALSDQGVGPMLGRPDYVTVTEEDKAPNSLYVKFARDMSREVCDRMIEADLARSGEPTLWRYASIETPPTNEQIVENTQYLILRFLSLRLDADDSMVTSFRTLYDTGVAEYQPGGSPGTNAQTAGWRAVCIGLFEDPAFHLH